MNRYIIWCSDLNKNTGEGELANKFINYYFKKKKITKINFSKSFFLSKYIYPYIAILILWYYYIRGFKTVYVNYLPLWNTIIYLSAPPKTVFGPITGSIQINKINNYKALIRFFIFPLLYRLSLKVLVFREKKILFASNILKKFVNKNLSKKVEYNFVLKDIKITKFKFKKNYDLIVYFNNHENKFFYHHINYIEKLVKRKKKIIVIGDKINIHGVKQLKKVSKRKMVNLLKQSRYALSGDDNLLSLFNIECIKYRVKILSNNKLKFQVPKKLRGNFIFYNSSRT